jgi:hypothetical protein
VLDLVANTFRALVDYAEWNVGPKNVEEKKTKEKENEPKPNFVEKSDGDPDDDGGLGGKLKKTELHYNIQIHLPESRDQAVHDALFRSLKKHLF